MKVINFLLRILVFFVGFLAAAWFFMPWAQGGEYVLLRATQGLKAPASVTYSSVEDAGGGFVIKDLNARGVKGILNYSGKTLTVRPDLLGSLMRMAPTARISFTGNVLEETMIFLKKIPPVYIGDGGLDVSVGRREILLEDVRSNGDLALRGAMALAPGADRIIAWSDVAVKIKSDSFEKELPALQQALGLPLRQESPGQWQLYRERPKSASSNNTPGEAQPK